MDAALTKNRPISPPFPTATIPITKVTTSSSSYIIFSLLGAYVDVEVRTPRGRVDVVLRTQTTLYVMELKLDAGADKAMAQIDLKRYPERFALCGLPMVKVAVSFDSEKRTISEWKIG